MALLSHTQKRPKIKDTFTLHSGLNMAVICYY